jgi:excisionase family DNA binding protein
MALHSIPEAAKLAGVTRQTMYKAVKDGRISATEGTEGGKVIDTAELLRVYPNLKVDRESTPDDNQIDTARQLAEKDAEAMRRENALLREQLGEVRADRDRLIATIDHERRLLPAPAPQVSPEATEPRRKRFWQR